MTAPIVESTEITLEDIAPPCCFEARPGEPCQHTAEWACVGTCGCLYLFCDPHKEDQVHLGSKFPPGMILHITCRYCRAVVTNNVWASMERL